MSFEFITAVKDICLAGAAITTATIAIQGLKSWKRELRGKADFDIARAVILHSYKLRDEISYSRSSVILSSQYPSDYDPFNKTVESEYNALAYVYFNRWKPVLDAIQCLEAQALEAEVLWGKDIKNKVAELVDCAISVRLAMDAMLDNKARNNEDFKDDKEYAKRVKGDLWKSSNGNDPLSQKIEKVVSDIELLIKPHLRRN